MQIKTRKHFNEIIQSLTEEVVDEEELEEATSTGDVEGYNTPFAFTSGKGKKRKRKISTNSTGYRMVKEELGTDDVVKIKKIIRDEVSNIISDIWLKRTAWKGK